MEKPDFEALHKTEKFHWTIGPDFVAGCEHVWNTHVVPLQKELAHEVNQREEYFEDAQILLDDKKKLESENKALREEQERCLKALEQLANYNKNLLEDIERLKAEVKNANSALDNISDMGHA